MLYNFILYFFLPLLCHAPSSLLPLLPSFPLPALSILPDLIVSHFLCLLFPSTKFHRVTSCPLPIYPLPALWQLLFFPIYPLLMPHSCLLPAASAHGSPAPPRRDSLPRPTPGSTAAPTASKQDFMATLRWDGNAEQNRQVSSDSGGGQVRLH